MTWFSKLLEKYLGWCDHDMHIIQCDAGGYVERCSKCHQVYIYPGKQ